MNENIPGSRSPYSVDLGDVCQRQVNGHGTISTSRWTTSTTYLLPIILQTPGEVFLF